jgi:hypothetical protein
MRDINGQTVIDPALTGIELKLAELDVRTSNQSSSGQTTNFQGVLTNNGKAVGGNPFDQNLSTTEDVRFNSVSTDQVSTNSLSTKHLDFNNQNPATITNGAELEVNTPGGEVTFNGDAVVFKNPSSTYASTLYGGNMFFSDGARGNVQFKIEQIPSRTMGVISIDDTSRPPQFTLRIAGTDVIVAEASGMSIKRPVGVDGNRIRNVADPIDSTDAATKSYVDASIGWSFNDFSLITGGLPANSWSYYQFSISPVSTTISQAKIWVVTAGSDSIRIAMYGGSTGAGNGTLLSQSAVVLAGSFNSGEPLQIDFLTPFEISAGAGYVFACALSGTTTKLGKLADINDVNLIGYSTADRVVSGFGNNPQSLSGNVGRVAVVLF